MRLREKEARCKMVLMIPLKNKNKNKKTHLLGVPLGCPVPLFLHHLPRSDIFLQHPMFWTLPLTPQAKYTSPASPPFRALSKSKIIQPINP